MRVREWISKITGCSFVYRIKIEYFSAGVQPVASIYKTVFLTHPRHIENHRAIKKLVSPELLAAIPKHRLSNGRLYLEPVCYLGFFKRKYK